MLPGFLIGLFVGAALGVVIMALAGISGYWSEIERREGGQ